MVFPLVLPIRLDLIQVKQIPKGAIAFHRDNLMMSRAKVGDSGTSKKSPRKLGGGWLVFLSTFEAFKEIWKSMTVYMEFTVFFWKVGVEYVVTVLGLHRDYPWYNTATVPSTNSTGAVAKSLPARLFFFPVRYRYTSLTCQGPLVHTQYALASAALPVAGEPGGQHWWADSTCKGHEGQGLEFWDFCFGYFWCPSPLEHAAVVPLWLILLILLRMCVPKTPQQWVIFAAICESPFGHSILSSCRSMPLWHFHLAQGLPGVEARNVSRFTNPFLQHSKNYDLKRWLFFDLAVCICCPRLSKNRRLHADSKRSYGAVDNCYKAGGFSKVLCLEQIY